MIYLKNNYLNQKRIANSLSIIALFLLMLTLTFSPVAFSQTVDTTTATTIEAQKTDTAYSNKTMKSVFKELKHITKTGSATLNSILMILGVVSVVAIAMWLSFRTDPEEEGA